VAIGVDSEVVTWFALNPPRGEYEKRINRVLSEHIAGEAKSELEPSAHLFPRSFSGQTTN